MDISLKHYVRDVNRTGHGAIWFFHPAVTFEAYEAKRSPRGAEKATLEGA
jgi:hypothetical protein